MSIINADAYLTSISIYLKWMTIKINRNILQASDAVIVFVTLFKIIHGIQVAKAFQDFILLSISGALTLENVSWKHITIRNESDVTHEDGPI